jgi:hypothetical protein
MNPMHRAAAVAILTALAAIQFGTEGATAQSGIAFVQANYAVPQTAPTVVTVPACWGEPGLGDDEWCGDVVHQPHDHGSRR